MQPTANARYSAGWVCQFKSIGNSATLQCFFSKTWHAVMLGLQLSFQLCHPVMRAWEGSAGNTFPCNHLSPQSLPPLSPRFISLRNRPTFGWFVRIEGPIHRWLRHARLSQRRRIHSVLRLRLAARILPFSMHV